MDRTNTLVVVDKDAPRSRTVAAGISCAAGIVALLLHLLPVLVAWIHGPAGTTGWGVHVCLGSHFSATNAMCTEDDSILWFDRNTMQVLKTPLKEIAAKQEGSLVLMMALDPQAPRLSFSGPRGATVAGGIVTIHLIGRNTAGKIVAQGQRKVAMSSVDVSAAMSSDGASAAISVPSVFFRTGVPVNTQRDKATWLPVISYEVTVDDGATPLGTASFQVQAG